MHPLVFICVRDRLYLQPVIFVKNNIADKLALRLLFSKLRK